MACDDRNVVFSSPCIMVIDTILRKFGGKSGVVLSKILGSAARASRYANLAFPEENLFSSFRFSPTFHDGL